jgi:hypothetical protein
VLYRWNQIDPQSGAILTSTVVMLCISFASRYFSPSHPYAAFATGACVGLLLGQTIPPRLSLRRLAINLLAIPAIIGILAVFHLL